MNETKVSMFRNPDHSSILHSRPQNRNTFAKLRTAKLLRHPQHLLLNFNIETHTTQSIQTKIQTNKTWVKQSYT